MCALTHQALIATSYLVISSFLSIKVDLDFRFSTNHAFKMDGFYLGHRKQLVIFTKLQYSLCVLKYRVIITGSKWILFAIWFSSVSFLGSSE